MQATRLFLVTAAMPAVPFLVMAGLFHVSTAALLVALGLSVAQGLFPIAGVTMMEHLGWRTAWMINAVIVGVAVALLFLPRLGDKAIRNRKDRSNDISSTKPL